MSWKDALASNRHHQQQRLRTQPKTPPLLLTSAVAEVRTNRHLVLLMSVIRPPGSGDVAAL